MMRIIIKIFLTAFMAAFFPGILAAQEWQYATADGEGYSYDANGVYTDSRGFSAFSSLNLDGANYSGMESVSVNTVHADRFPIMKSELGLTAYAPSVLSIEKSSIIDSDFRNLKISGTSNYDLYGFYISEDSSLENVDFSGSSFSATSSAVRSSAVVSNGFLKNVNFSGSTFVSFGAIDGNVTLSGNVENIDFSNSTFKGCIDSMAGYEFDGATMASALCLKGNTVKNINISGSTVNSWSGIDINAKTSVDTLIAHDVKFINVNAEMFAKAMGQGANSDTQTLKSIDLRGSTVAYFGTSDVKTITIDDVSFRNVENSMVGDGVIYSFNNGDSNSNRGLVLSEGEIFTVLAHEISAKLTVDSILTGGTIDIKDGGIFEIADNVTLTLSDSVNFVFDAGAAEGVNDILVLGEGTTVVMSGYDSDKDARAAFVGLFHDSNGNGVDWNPETVSDFVVAGGAVPEPSFYALILCVFAAVFAVRRRKR